jgi:hypothetical protein
MSHPNAQSYVLPGNPMWREYFSYPPLRPPMAYSHTITYVPLLSYPQVTNMPYPQVTNMPYPQVTNMPYPQVTNMPYPQVTNMPYPHITPTQPVSQFAYRTIPLHLHQ